MSSNVIRSRRLKVAIIREEFVAITGDFAKAVILDQLLTWNYETQDFNAFNAAELSDMTMLGLSVPDMEKHLEELVNMGLVKSNVTNWRAAGLYQVDFPQLTRTLAVSGYALEGYRECDETHF